MSGSAPSPTLPTKGEGAGWVWGTAVAPSTMLRMVPLLRFAGEDQRWTLRGPILPRLRGRGTAEGGGGGG